jgi:hypothetical protein
MNMVLKKACWPDHKEIGAITPAYGKAFERPG